MAQSAGKFSKTYDWSKTKNKRRIVIKAKY